MKIIIRDGGGNPDIIFCKKNEEQYLGSKKTYIWEEVIMSYDIRYDKQYHELMGLWKFFFNDVSHFDKYRIEETLLYR